MILGGADITIIEMKHAINVILNHPQTIPPTLVCEKKLSSVKLVPGAKKSKEEGYT